MFTREEKQYSRLDAITDTWRDWVSEPFNEWQEQRVRARQRYLSERSSRWVGEIRYVGWVYNKISEERLSYLKDKLNKDDKSAQALIQNLIKDVIHRVLAEYPDINNQFKRSSRAILHNSSYAASEAKNAYSFCKDADLETEFCRILKDIHHIEGVNYAIAGVVLAVVTLGLLAASIALLSTAGAAAAPFLASYGASFAVMTGVTANTIGGALLALSAIVAVLSAYCAYESVHNLRQETDLKTLIDKSKSSYSSC